MTRGRGRDDKGGEVEMTEGRGHPGFCPAIADLPFLSEFFPVRQT